MLIMNATQQSTTPDAESKGGNFNSAMNIANMRNDYRRGRLRREDLKPDPIEQFNVWLEEACRAGVIEPTAMSLATGWSDGRLLVRTVLLKGLDARGFVFFTNLESRKARQISDNPKVSLLFPWLALERQVIVTGCARKIPVVEALKYFATRPRGSQLAAWASRQSSAISSRKVLEMEWERIKHKFGAGQIPLPSFWGGYRVSAQTIEFWQGGPDRLHDRFEYTHQTDGSWMIARLAP
jgi:pyridoxamine 5'-phosphate oxidase